MPEIYRAPMRAGDHPAGTGAEYGLRHDLVGIGRVPGEKGERMRRRFAALPDGTFVWTRTTDGRYFVGRISGPCRDDPGAASAVGLHHVRPVRWRDRPVGDDDVPAAVAATFARGGRNFQRTHDGAGERRTAELWDEA